MLPADNARASRALLGLLGGPAPAPAPALASPASPPPRSNLASARMEARLASLLAAPPADPAQLPEKSTRFARLWVHGVGGVGQRDAALYDLAKDSLYRRRSQERAVAQIQAWIERGGIAASRAAARSGGVEWEVADVPRRVGVVYGTHPHPHRPPAVHLSAREVRGVTELATRQAAVTGLPAGRIGAMLLRALPVFKGCAHAGLPAARVHCREWEHWGGPSYTQLRAAAGIFEPVSGYVSQQTLRDLGRNPADAHARNWSVDFTFDPAGPRRRLGGTYRAAKLAAELAEGRTAKAAERAAKAERKVVGVATESTLGTSTGTATLERHIQTPPAPAPQRLVGDVGDPAPGSSSGPNRSDISPVRSPLPAFERTLSLAFSERERTLSPLWVCSPP